MTNDEIFNKILSDIEVLLSSHNTFKYAASANTITDVRLEKERQRIIFKRNGEKQSANYDNLKKIADAFALYKPISIDAVFNGGGNARSAIEAILVRLPHVGFLPANTILNPGAKMLLWLDSPKNNFNSIYNVEDFDLSQAVIANANLNNNAPAIRLRATNQDLTDFKNKFTLDIQSIGLKISSHDLLRNTTALLAKPFLILTGLSGSGKTKLAEALAYWLSSEPNKQICVVAVGADWTNNEPLLGYADAYSSCLTLNQKLNKFVEELAKFYNDRDLPLNKKKSEILISEDLQEIGGIKCVKAVKYLGVRVTIDKKEQTNVARENNIQEH
jgi:hypothetical protein